MIGSSNEALLEAIVEIEYKSHFCGLNGSYGCPRNESLPYPTKK
jgi:hypothetical protein